MSVENHEEYFANGILVHNCHDAARYAKINCLKLLTADIPGTNPPKGAKRKNPNPARRD